MINSQVPAAFLKTAYYWFQTYGKSKEQIDLVKQAWAKMSLRSFGYELEVAGPTPAFGSAVLVGNHISFLDIFVIMSVVPESTFVAKKELLFWPVVGPAAHKVGTIFVDRRPGVDRSGIRKEIDQALANSNVKVVTFPSGTTTLRENLPWKVGIFEIAKRAQVPMQLFRIDYTPRRESAYVDDDNILVQMNQLGRFKNKKAKLTWVDRVEQVESPIELSQNWQQKLEIKEAP